MINYSKILSTTIAIMLLFLIMFSCAPECNETIKYKTIYVDTFSYERIDNYADSVLKLRRQEIDSIKKEAINEAKIYRDKCKAENDSIKNALHEYSLYLDTIKNYRLHDNVIAHTNEISDTMWYNKHIYIVDSIIKTIIND